MKKFLCLFTIMLAISTGAIGQDSSRKSTDTVEIQEPIIPIEYKDPGTDTSRFFAVVETMPEFPGGIVAMHKYIEKNMRYPPQAIKHNITGKVMVEFVIDENGYVTNARIVRGIGYGCDEEALRVVRAMPRWTPGTQKGKNVKVRFVLPLRFDIEEPWPRKKRKKRN